MEKCPLYDFCKPSAELENASRGFAAATEPCSAERSATVELIVTKREAVSANGLAVNDYDHLLPEKGACNTCPRAPQSKRTS
jgi:hypothetical protein